MNDEQGVCYLVIQMKCNKAVAGSIKRDLTEFDSRNANGNIALHFNRGVVQKIHSTQVS